jgi:hypothetical protein
MDSSDDEFAYDPMVDEFIYNEFIKSSSDDDDDDDAEMMMMSILKQMEKEEDVGNMPC